MVNIRILRAVRIFWHLSIISTACVLAILRIPYEICTRTESSLSTLRDPRTSPSSRLEINYDKKMEENFGSVGLWTNSHPITWSYVSIYSFILIRQLSLTFRVSRWPTQLKSLSHFALFRNILLIVASIVWNLVLQKEAAYNREASFPKQFSDNITLWHIRR